MDIKDLPPGTFDHSLEALADAETRVDELVLREYGASPGPLQADPRENLLAHDDQRAAQTAEMLRQLGYLPRPGSAPGPFSAGDIAEAWAEWTMDHDRDILWVPSFEAEQTALPPFPVLMLTEQPAGRTREDLLRRRLKACVSLEGEVRLRTLPEVGLTTLASRVALFRMRLFGLCNETSDTPMPGDLYEHLRSRAGWLGDTARRLSDVELLHALGDAPALGRAVAGRLEGWGVVLGVVSREDQASSPVAVRGVPLGSFPRGRRRGPRGTFARRPGFKLLNVERPDEASWNELAVKVLQVRLWTLGYYPGAIDGSWGPASDAALDAYLADDADSPRLDIVRLDDTYRALRISPLLRNIAVHADDRVASLEQSDIDAALADLPGEAEPGDRLDNPDTQGTLWGRLSDAAGRAAEAGDALARSHDERRQPYFGWRGLFAAFGRVLTRVGDAVRGLLDKLKKAVAAGLHFVRDIARYIRDTARVAVRVASLGLRRLRAWLLGAPIITSEGTAAVVTLWSMDFDTVRWISPDASRSLTERHAREIDWMHRSFAVCVRVGLAVLNLALAFGNWLFFAWRAVQLVRTVVAAGKDGLFQELLEVPTTT